MLNISSAIPLAIFPIIFADAGATINMSAFLARDICFTSNSKFLSNVSTIHLLLVSVSNVIGFIKLQAFSVISTCTSAFILTSALATSAIL